MNAHLIQAEISLAAIARNVQALRALTQPSACLMAVVKANGYGHGACEVARTALEHGADRLAVARLDEARALRQAGIQAPLLVFGYTPPEMVPELIEHDLAVSLYDLDVAKRFSQCARLHRARIKVHIKVDTGMGRVGLLSGHLQGAAPSRDQASQHILAMARLPGLALEGLYTHFATADSRDKTLARKQLEVFLTLDAHLRQQGLEIPLKHAANSAALIDLPETHLDMVRPGIALYGLYPSDEVDRTRVVLQPAMTLKTRVVHIKKVPAGFGVSYGHTYTTTAATTLATVAAGYADGLNRRLSSRGCMLVHGRRAPIVGRVCMDLTMLDVGHIPQTATGDEVVIWGQQQDAEIHVDDVAKLLGTINYEVVSAVGGRVARCYCA